MDLNFVDPAEAPVPPEEVRVRSIEIKPMADGRRLRVQLDLTPFHERPSLAVRVFGPRGETVAATNIIETLDPRLEFTLHLREPAGTGEYRMRVEAGYREGDPVDVKEVDFRLTAM